MKRFVIILLLLTFVSLTRITLAQSLKFGFSIEPSLLFYDEGSKSSVSFIPFSANLKILVTPLNWLNFEARPGVFFGSPDYNFSWIEIGGYARFNILPTRFYFIAGVSDHIRGGYDDMLYNGAGIGFQKDSKLSFDLIIYWKNGVKDNRINGILKAGFNLAWDIL